MKEELKSLLKELWDNDNSVPGVTNTRCTGLDWYSSGVKDNVVAHIALKMLSMAEFEDLLKIPYPKNANIEVKKELNAG